jgi:hypothetical protein
MNNRVENLEYISQQHNIIKGNKPRTNTGLKHISEVKYGSYLVQIHRHNIKYSRRFKTLEEALVARDDYLRQEGIRLN